MSAADWLVAVAAITLVVAICAYDTRRHLRLRHPPPLTTTHNNKGNPMNPSINAPLQQVSSRFPLRSQWMWGPDRVTVVGHSIDKVQIESADHHEGGHTVTTLSLTHAIRVLTEVTA